MHSVNFDDPMRQFFSLFIAFKRYHEHICGTANHKSPHHGQGLVLDFLRDNPNINQTELAEKLGIRAQSLGEFLSKLEKSGMIERSTSESDKRARKVTVTKKGLELYDKIESIKESSEKLFSCLSEKELKHLQDYVDRLIKHIGSVIASERKAGE